MEGGPITSEETRIERFWIAKLIIASMVITAEIVFCCLKFSQPVITAIICGFLVGFTAFLALVTQLDDFGEFTGYFFGVATAIIVGLGKTGHYIWMSICIVVVVGIVAAFHYMAMKKYGQRSTSSPSLDN